MTVHRTALWRGVKSMAPLLMGMIPFGMITGIAAVDAGYSALGAVAMSAMVFAGAAQLAMAQLIDADALAFVIVLTAWIINLRFAMYSATIAPHFSGLPPGLRLVLAYFLTDQAFALSITRFGTHQDGLREKLWFFLGAGVVMWPIWLAATWAGALLGAGVPPQWSLDFAVPLSFLALLVPALRDRPAVVAALVGGSVAVLAAGLPFNLGMLLAAVAGIAAGMVSEYALRRRGQI